LGSKLAEKVRAVVYPKPKEFNLSQFERPKATENSILMRVEMCGVCGTDVHTFKGEWPGVNYPIIPGHEVVGVIEELGRKAEENMIVYGGPLREGDRIHAVPGVPCGKCYYCKYIPHRVNMCQNREIYGVTRSCRDYPHLFGGWAQYMYILPRTHLYKMPSNMPPELCAIAEPLTVAVRAISRASVPGIPLAGEGFGIANDIVVQGSGVIGILTIIAAKTAGAGRTVVIDGIEERLKLAKQFGADCAVNIQDYPTPEDRIKEVKRLTNGVGADVVIECTGVPSTVPEGLEMLRFGGKYIEVGNLSPSPTLIDPYIICRRELEIIGLFAYHPNSYRPALKILADHKFPIEKLITHRFSLDEAQKMFDTYDRKEGLALAFVP
jgi:L-iditol 2-dehydrogenase